MDDPWYRVRNSEDYQNNLDYAITYYKPEGPYDGLVAWNDSEGGSGPVPYSKYHIADSYYPPWEDGKVTLSGAHLPDCMK